MPVRARKPLQPASPRVPKEPRRPRVVATLDGTDNSAAVVELLVAALDILTSREPG